MPEYARIIVDVHHQKVDRIYTYLSGACEGQLRPGMLVKVPFGSADKSVNGYVLSVSSDPEDLPKKALSRLKTVQGLVSRTPVLTEDQIKIAREMAERYMAPLSSCLSLFLSKDPQQSDLRQVEMVSAGLALKELDLNASRLGSAQKAFLHALQTCGLPKVPLSYLRQKAPLTRASLRSLQEHQYIVISLESEGFPPADFVSAENEKARSVPPALTSEQQEAAQAIEPYLKAPSFHEFLLFGITGSGKTEVYMHCIEKVLEEGRQAIMLVPEISLTPQFIDVFTKRFGSQAGITHSRMTSAQRAEVWRLSRAGRYRIMIGPRSALFTPFQNLGLIIMDEEHESSYRSEQMAPHYHARDVAEMMGRRLGIPVLLGSATPSVESAYRAQQGQITLLRLSHRAVSQSALPSVSLVDMREEMALGNMGIFSQGLVEGISRGLKKKEQTILFLNRKGYATFVNCRSCGFVLKCPRCCLPYTYHKDVDRLICHHCGKSVPMPAECPNCGSSHIRQFGVGTQRVEEETRRLFPGASIVRMDMETMKKREDYEKVYRTFRDGTGDILIGTQMVSKGFDFPRVTLVGVVSADLTLYSGDFHSTERTFQLLMQVSGRAGRAGLPGEVIIQTFSPDHYCMKAVRDQSYEAFFRQELSARKIMQAPPFTHLSQIVLTAASEEAVKEASQALCRLLLHYAKGRPIEVLGPSPAQLYRVNNIFRWKLLIKCTDEARLRAYTQYCVKKFEDSGEGSRVLVTADVDPMTIL